MDTQARREAALACILDLGELLLTSGAEVMRVEDTVARLCAAYGFETTDVFTITSSIVVTARAPDGRVLTQTRRIRERSTDLGCVERVNALSRRLCTSPLPVEELPEAVREAACGPRWPDSVQLAAYVCVSAVFTLFFGGSPADALAAAAAGAVLFAALRAGGGLRINGLLLAFAASAAAAFAVAALRACGLACAPDRAVVGNIMLLIPGLAFTTSLRDMIRGDTISGLLGLSEAVVKALAVAAGFAVVLYGAGGGV